MEEIFEISSCIEILANNIKIYTIEKYMFYIVNKELQGIHTGTSLSLRM